MGRTGTTLEPEVAQRVAQRSRPGRLVRLTRLLGVLLALVAWLGLAGVGGPLVGRLSEVQKNDNASFLPRSAESTEVGALAEKSRWQRSSAQPRLCRTSWSSSGRPD